MAHLKRYLSHLDHGFFTLWFDLNEDLSMAHFFAMTSKMSTQETATEDADFLVHHLQAQHYLSALLTHSPEDEALREKIDKVICMMLEINDKADPDTLARAAYFVVKSASSFMTQDDVQRIRRNGGRENNSWPSLVPIITDLLINQE